MSDIDALVADLRAVVEQSTEGTHVPGSPIMRGAVLAERAVKAIESLRVERDAALEVMGNHKCGENVEAALTEVIGKVTDLWDEPLDDVHDIPQIARAVAAWRLKGGARG